MRKNISEGRERYPFSYIYLHGNLNNILITLYIDRDAQIRGVDVQELTDDDIFSNEWQLGLGLPIGNFTIKTY